MTPRDLRRAAEILEEYAVTIKAGNSFKGQWRLDFPDQRAAKKECDEMLDLARKLRAEAKKAKA